MQLAILNYGTFQVHKDGRLIGIPGYCIRADQRIILVDTGFPDAYAYDAEAASAFDGLGVFGQVVNLTPDNLPAAQLALLGIRPDQVTDLLLTHTHIDHVGGIEHFPQAQIIIGAAERALPAPLYWADRRPYAWPEVTYLLIERDTELLPGLTLLATPGHSPGHLSLVLDFPDGTIMLTADAISRPAELMEDRFGGAWDEAQTRMQAQRLMQLAEQLNAFVIYGHDPQQWPRLPKAPHWINARRDLD
jgi:N-acyl homoserine lactone hydrolase